MITHPQIARYAALIGCGIVSATSTFAQVSSINSAVIQSRVFNDVPGAVFTGVNNYPGSISLSEVGVGAATGFANRDQWRFSNNGSTPYSFQHNDYFNASMTLNLTGTPITPRKEGGFLFSTASDGDIQFIVNTDGHEVVQFGGISFYSFSANNGLTYNSGQPITLGMSYFLDGNGKNALQFFANGIGSPIFEFGPTVGSGALDIGDGSTLGGYLQVVNDPNNASNSGSALFSNITISVPEPSSAALLGLGALTIFLRRRRA
jgi:hypothetical protein